MATVESSHLKKKFDCDLEIDAHSTLHVSYVHSLISYEDLRATINHHTNRRSWKIKQYSKHLYNYN